MSEASISFDNMILDDIMKKLDSIEKKINNFEKNLKSFKQEVIHKLNILENKIELNEIAFNSLITSINFQKQNSNIDDFNFVYVREGTGINTTRVKKVRSSLI